MARYTKEFKTEAVGQVLERGYSVKEVSAKIGYLPIVYIDGLSMIRGIQTVMPEPRRNMILQQKMPG